VAGPQAAARTASAFATDAYAQTARYFVAYPEDVKLYRLSFNTALGTYAWQGEASYRQDAPLLVDDVELLFAALGPINPGLAAFNQLGDFSGRFETVVPGVRRLASADFLRVSVVGNTTQQVFQEVGAGNDDDAVWASTSVNVSSFAGQTVRILIEAADAGGASLVEAAVDDVRIQSQ
jgi:hypothetical protein